MSNHDLESFYLLVRDLGDGRKAGILSLTFGRARIVTWLASDPRRLEQEF
jgi:hypothetical protein